MIRRITKNNDLKDLIKSCPTGVIDDIYSIRYYIAGNPDVEIEPTFSKVNNHLEVVIPSSLLENLGNGILMRRALYKAADPEYPDGYYDLEFVDNMDVWLGDDEVDPFEPGGEYLTAADLKTINNQSIVGTGNITIEVPDYYATKSWVSSQGYLTSVPTGYATKSWVSSQGYLTSVPTGYATKSWVSSQGYLTSVPSGYATESYVTTALSSYALLSDIPSLEGYATESWVSEQGYLTSVPSGYATESYVTTALSGYATESFVTSALSSYATLSDIPSLEGYATESWVSEQGYLTSVPSGYATESYVTTALSGYATESWVEYFVDNNDQNPCVRIEAFGDLLSIELQNYDYATESWVSGQGYLTSVPSGYATESYVTTALSGYATESWVTSTFLSQGAVWTGTQSEWEQLSPAQQATYIIALVTE